ncbi:MAG TPA: cytochrome c1 [Steroidobacteraceae bacterium]
MRSGAPAGSLALMLAIGGVLRATVALSAPNAGPVNTGGAPVAAAMQAAEAVEHATQGDWKDWHAGNSVTDLASLQRGARNFMNYCNGCHSLKYERYQRMADDLKIPAKVLEADLVAPGSSNLDYISTPLPSSDAVNWFGKVPPDLSLITRSKGTDYVYRYLKTFYVDPSSPTGSNNLAYPSAAMPDVLSALSGVNEAVFRQVGNEKEFDHFVTVVPGSMTSAQFDDFVRDTVNFLDYVGEPEQAERRFMGIWVVLFLIALSALAWLLKSEYWKEVH